MYKSTVQESPDGLVLTVPDDMRIDLALAAGAELELELDSQQLVVRRVHPRYTLQELLDQCDGSLPISEEDRQWESMAPVGRELL